MYLGHYRRYTLREVEATVKASGLEVVKGCYYYGAVLPAVGVARLLNRIMPKEAGSDMRHHSVWVNWVLGTICSTELRVFQMN